MLFFIKLAICVFKQSGADNSSKLGGQLAAMGHISLNRDRGIAVGGASIQIFFYHGYLGGKIQNQRY